MEAITKLRLTKFCTHGDEGLDPVVLELAVYRVGGGREELGGELLLYNQMGWDQHDVQTVVVFSPLN